MNTSFFQKCSLFLTVLSSSSTLICCAIPALLVLVGAGASLAGFVGFFPQVVWLSEHKLWVFGFGALMLTVSRLMQLSQTSCPIDPELAKACKSTQAWSKVLWWFSVAMYFVGAGVAFVLPLFLN